MMNGRTCFAMVCAGLMAAGCQSLRVKTQYDHQVAFSDLHTFCWVAPPAWLHNDPRLHMDLLEPLVQHDVVTGLSARGYRETDCATADFQVTFTGGLHESFTEAPSPESGMVYQYNADSGGEWFVVSANMNVKEKRVASMIMQVRRPGSDHIVWQGSVSGNLPAPVNDAQRVKRVQTAVSMILKQFPPPPGK